MKLGKRSLAVIIIITSIVISSGMYWFYRTNQPPSISLSEHLPSTDTSGQNNNDNPLPIEKYQKVETNPRVDQDQSWWHELIEKTLKDSGKDSEKLRNDQIIEVIREKLGTEVDKNDLFQAGSIILKKLSSEEISYVFQVGRKDKRSPEEMAKVKEILQDKLTSEEIKILQDLGVKYGKNLSFLSK
ncbi:MAG: hypothetical protein ACOX0E_09660 [Syntrophomonadaceae bacterium]|jgi:hypothetical protein